MALTRNAGSEATATQAKVVRRGPNSNRRHQMGSYPTPGCRIVGGWTDRWAAGRSCSGIGVPVLAIALVGLGVRIDELADLVTDGAHVRVRHVHRHARAPSVVGLPWSTRSRTSETCVVARAQC